MRNFILLLMAFIGMNVSAQHIPGVKTISTFEVLQGVYDNDGKLLYFGTAINQSTIVGVVTKQYLYDHWSISADGESLRYEGPSLNGSEILPVYIAGKLLKPGSMYKFEIRDGAIASVELWSNREVGLSNITYLEYQAQGGVLSYEEFVALGGKKKNIFYKWVYFSEFFMDTDIESPVILPMNYVDVLKINPITLVNSVNDIARFLPEPQKKCNISGVLVWCKEDADRIVKSNNWVSHKEAANGLDMSKTSKLEGPFVKVDGVIFTREEYNALFK